MSPFDLSPVQSGRVGLTPASGSADVRWIRPATPGLPPPPMRRSSDEKRAERANALIVLVLTLACTALALYDLFLLAAGA
jgi:hypothetical protein